MKSAQRLIPTPLILALLLPFASKAEDSDLVKQIKADTKARIEANTKLIEANAKMHEASAKTREANARALEASATGKSEEAEVAKTIASIARTAIETAKWYKANKGSLDPVILKTKVDGVYDRFHAKEPKITGSRLTGAVTDITKALKGYPEIAALINTRLPRDINKFVADGRLSPPEGTGLKLDLGIQVSSVDNNANTGRLLAAAPDKKQ